MSKPPANHSHRQHIVLIGFVYLHMYQVPQKLNHVIYIWGKNVICLNFSFDHFCRYYCCLLKRCYRDRDIFLLLSVVSSAVVGVGSKVKQIANTENRTRTSHASIVLCSKQSRSYINCFRHKFRDSFWA
jgi:hypothetical protein